jgi:hypothetical protein
MGTDLATNRKVCAADDCDRVTIARGYCTKHYQQLARHIGFEPIQRKVCITCGARHEARGFCRRHYKAFIKHGDPLVVGVSAGRFTSKEMKRRWKTKRYRNLMADRARGSKNWNFKNAKKQSKCKICSRQFDYYPSNHSEGKYCSIPCASKSVERSENLRKANLGKRATEETRRKLSLAHIGLHVGEKSGSWKGGISKLHQGLRRSPEYARWRLAVFERDGYQCRLCGSRGGKLIADHHPYPFAKYPEHRLNINNGRTLCLACNHYVTNVTKEWRYA